MAAAMAKSASSKRRTGSFDRKSGMHASARNGAASVARRGPRLQPPHHITCADARKTMPTETASDAAI